MTRRAGFSLIELAIVLVILGLLVGGIMTGQSLIRAAELRSVTRELQGYQAAVGTFRDKYLALPGDMRNATAFWGKDNTNCTTDTGTAATPGTCNGNGNGFVEYGTAEMHRFWQHLALSGLISGNFTGVTGPDGSSHVIPGVNGPKSALSNSGWTAHYIPPLAGNSEVFRLDDYGNIFAAGTPRPAETTKGANLSPEEAWSIDTKLDDGKPAYGSVIAMFWDNVCSAADDGTSANNDLNASYRLSDKSLKCSLMFIKQF